MREEPAHTKVQVEWEITGGKKVGATCQFPMAGLDQLRGMQSAALN